MEEAIELLEEADHLGLRVLLDLVPNHTSCEHVWFQEALASPPGSRARARYHFRPGRGLGGSVPPTDWTSVFGGPTWTRVGDGDWYLHLFDPSQPDLNWTNPEVRAEFLDILRFWLDRGASGFRVDVANGLDKDPNYPDIGEVDQIKRVSGGSLHPYSDRDLLHEIVREWRAVVDEYPNAILVAEAWVESWERLARYLRPDEYHQAFDFEFMESPWEEETMRSAISRAVPTAGSVGAVPTWVLSNHDIVRQVTRYGLPQTLGARDWLLDGDRSLLDADVGWRRARAAALLMLGLPGSAYIYQGEELGLPEVYDLPLDALDDPTWTRSGRTMKGRDGCRVPIPWTATGASFGFGSDGSWLPQPADWATLSVETQEHVPDSTLQLYRNAIRLRSQHLSGNESFEWVSLEPGCLAFRRGSVLVVVNFGEGSASLPEGRVLVASNSLDSGFLPADTTAWLLTDRD
jgi:alpha-glucosidase